MVGGKLCKCVREWENVSGRSDLKRLGLLKKKETGKPLTLRWRPQVCSLSGCPLVVGRGGNGAGRGVMLVVVGLPLLFLPLGDRASRRPPWLIFAYQGSVAQKCIRSSGVEALSKGFVLPWVLACRGCLWGWGARGRLFAGVFFCYGGVLPACHQERDLERGRLDVSRFVSFACAVSVWRVRGVQKE